MEDELAGEQHGTLRNPRNRHPGHRAPGSPFQTHKSETAPGTAKWRSRRYEPRPMPCRRMMDPGAEGEVAVRRAADVEASGSANLLRIAVGGRADAQRDWRVPGIAMPPSSMARTIMRLPSGSSFRTASISSTAKVLNQRGILDQTVAYSAGFPIAPPTRYASGWFVVSWPALSRKMQLCSNSFAVQPLAMVFRHYLSLG